MAIVAALKTRSKKGGDNKDLWLKKACCFMLLERWCRFSPFMFSSMGWGRIFPFAYKKIGVDWKTTPLSIAHLGQFISMLPIDKLDNLSSGEKDLQSVIPGSALHHSKQEI
jgi:hypothetical protein